MARVEKVIAAIADLVGPVRLIEDHSWPGVDLAVVLRVETRDGQELIAKCHADRRNFDRELTAYRTWVKVLGDRAPRLIGADEEAGILAISVLPGVHLNEAVARGAREESLYFDAGAAIRRLHDAYEPTFDVRWAERLAASLEKWVARARPGVLDPGDVAWVKREMTGLLGMPPPPLVVCHGDFQPRNWRIDAGVVRIFDFERTEADWWVFDFQRMWPQQWRNRPFLAEAFFDGYGRRPSDVELRGIWAICAGRALLQIPYALEHGDAQFAESAREVLRWMRREGALRRG